jgi:flagellar L-ring protein precursor FlgH
MKTRSASAFRCVFAALLLSALVVGGCVMTSAKLPAPPPKYVSAKGAGEEPRTPNSLWRDTSGIIEDFRARRLNDLVTINVLESISGSGGANTATGRKSSIDASVNTFFGANLDRFSPAIGADMKDDFSGKGMTNRSGTIIGTITARVVEVMPNGTLEVESRKDITINNEKQTMVLRGSVRPEDISVTNTIPSTKVADAEIFLVGDGVLQDKQKPGWFVRIFDNIWPF